MDNYLIEFNSLINKLQLINGRKEKEQLLFQYKDNDIIKDIFHFIFNPYITTGISKKKFQKQVNIEFNYELDNLINVIHYLIIHNSGKDIDVANIQYYVNNNYEYKDLIQSIVTKDLKIGIQPITLNKIFGKGFIPTFDVMLAEKFFDDPEKYLPYGTEFTLTQKLDGVRCICIKERDRVEFYSRQGQPFEGLNELVNEVSLLSGDFVLDGELLLENTQGLSSKDLYRATIKETNKDGDKHNLIYNIFDILKPDEFREGKSLLKYKERRDLLNILSKSLPTKQSLINDIYKPSHLYVLPTLYQGIDQLQIQYWLDKITSEGGEGVMINLNDAPYECKRTKNILKVKKMQTMDLRVVGMEEGEGVNKGRLGALKVEFPAPDGNTYIVDVGGGYTFEDRDYFWNNKDDILGKIIEIQYFEVSQNDNGGYSLRFPVYLQVRNDKDEVSVY